MTNCEFYFLWFMWKLNLFFFVNVMAREFTHHIQLSILVTNLDTFTLNQIFCLGNCDYCCIFIWAKKRKIMLMNRNNYFLFKEMNIWNAIKIAKWRPVLFFCCQKNARSHFATENESPPFLFSFNFCLSYTLCVYFLAI